MDRAFFFAYAVQELDGFREEAWKIFRQPLNRLLSISYKTKTCTDERLLAQKFFCHPETTFSVNPKPFSATLSLFYCHPEPFLLSPRAKRGVPRHLRASGRQGGKCRPEPPFFVAPRRQPRGLPPGDAVPNEVRDASLSLGRTE